MVHADGFSYFDTVLESYILMGSQSLILKVLLLYLSVQLIDLIINFLFLLRKRSYFFEVLFYLFFVVLLVRFAHPPDCVLLSFFNIADALKHIRDVVYAPFLHFEASHCVIEIERVVR